MEARIATRPQHLVAQAAAENLQIVEDLVVNKEQRIPDIAYFSTKPDPASTATNLLLHGQEFHTSYWGHLGLLNLTQNFLLPGYAAYPNTAAASLFPANAMVADMAHAAARAGGICSSLRFGSRSGERRVAQPRTAGGSRAGQSGLHRSDWDSRITNRPPTSGTAC